MLEIRRSIPISKVSRVASWGWLVVACLGVGASLSCATSQAGTADHGARAALVAADRTARDPSLSELMLMGDREREAGAHDKAHLAYVRAHFSDRESLVPLERIAYLALRTDAARAQRLFTELLEEAPGKPTFLVGLAYAELAQGRLDEAQAALAGAISADPNSAAAHAALAVVQDMVREHDLARASNDRALGSDKIAIAVLNNQGVSSLLAGRSDTAISQLTRANRIDPESRLAANNLGLALAMEGFDQRAYDAFRLHGTRGDALNNLGVACYLRGDLAAARTHFEAALLSSETDDLRVLRNLERLETAARAPRIPGER